MEFLNELNAKHESIMFEHTENIDRQTFLNINSEHPKSLNSSIPYSQALRIKRICSETTNFKYQYNTTTLKQGYKKNLSIKNSQM